MQEEIQWEGGGMDVVIRLIDPEEELAEFLYQCDEFFEEENARRFLLWRHSNTSNNRKR